MIMVKNIVVLIFVKKLKGGLLFPNKDIKEISENFNFGTLILKSFLKLNTGGKDHIPPFICLKLITYFPKSLCNALILCSILCIILYSKKNNEE